MGELPSLLMVIFDINMMLLELYKLWFTGFIGHLMIFKPINAFIADQTRRLIRVLHL